MLPAHARKIGAAYKYVSLFLLFVPQTADGSSLCHTSQKLRKCCSCQPRCYVTAASQGSGARPVVACKTWKLLPIYMICARAGDTYNEPELAMFRYSPRVACVHYDGLEGFGALR